MNNNFILAAAIMLAAANDLSTLQQNLTNLINQAWPIIIGIISAVVVLWGLFIGFKYWQAGTQEKQREAKEYVKNFFIGLIAIFVVGVVAVALIGWLGDWAGTAGGLTN